MATSGISIIINLMITAWNGLASYLRNRKLDHISSQRYTESQNEKRNARTVKAISEYERRSRRIDEDILSKRLSKIQIKLEATVYFGRWSSEYLLNGLVNKDMLQQCIGISSRRLYIALHKDPTKSLESTVIYKKSLYNLARGLNHCDTMKTNRGDKFDK